MSQTPFPKSLQRPDFFSTGIPVTYKSPEELERLRNNPDDGSLRLIQEFLESQGCIRLQNIEDVGKDDVVAGILPEQEDSIDAKLFAVFPVDELAVLPYRNFGPDLGDFLKITANLVYLGVISRNEKNLTACRIGTEKSEIYLRNWQFGAGTIYRVERGSHLLQQVSSVPTRIPDHQSIDPNTLTRIYRTFRIQNLDFRGEIAVTEDHDGYSRENNPFRRYQSTKC